MGIAKKNRRKLDFAGRQFIWYVNQDCDSADMVLQVASEDKRFIVTYHLGQPDDRRFLIVMGREFGGLQDAGGKWLRVICPKWEKTSTVSSGTVRQLIEWALDPGKRITRVDWQGQIVVEGV